MRQRRPLAMAFSLTAAVVLFLVSGFAGFMLSRHDRFVAGTSWSPTVIWWQVWMGLAVVPLAAWFWRAGLRDLHRPR
jgi:succinate dehydrogenase hydrophobic anchor subunit